MTASDTPLRRIGTNSLVGSAWTLVSRLTGLGRAVVVAAVLGPTVFGDLYQQTSSLPALVFELLTGSLFLSLLVPALVRHLDASGTAAAARLASAFLTLSLVVAGVAAAAVVVAGPLVLHLLAAEVPDGVEPAEPAAAWLLLGLLMLQVPLYVVVGAGAAAQQARNRFALPAGAPAIENIGIVLVLGLHAMLFGIGTDEGQGVAGVAVLGAGSTAAVALHAAAQWWGARRQGLVLRLRRTHLDPELRALVRMAVPSMAHAALNVARYFCLLVAAAAVPGGVVALGLAWAFYALPVALGAKPVAQAALPELARAHQRGDTAGYGRTFDRALGLALFVAVPAAAAFALLAEPVATVVGFGQMATPEARSLVSLCLLGISAGVVGAAALNLATQAAYARQNAVGPLRAVALRAVLTVAGSVAAVALFDGPRLLLVLGAVVAGGDLLAGGWLSARVRGRVGAGMTRMLLRTAAATLAMAAVVWPISLALGSSTDRGAALLCLLLAGGGGIVAYLAAQRRLRSPEIDGLLALLGRRGRR